MEITFNPATKRQTYALKLATGIDYRNDNLSFEQASKLLQEANEKSGYFSKKSEYIQKEKNSKNSKIPVILHYLSSDKCIQILKNTICNEIKMLSIIQEVDINNVPKEKAKKYIFLGNGCGFSFIKWDKRNDKATRVIEKAKEIQKDIDNLVRQSFDKKVIDYLQSIGNPISAIQAQNMNYKSTYNQLIVEYLEKNFNVKNIYVETILD